LDILSTPNSFVVGASGRFSVPPGTPVHAFDQDVWAVALHYDEQNPRRSLAQFRALREANLDLLKLLSPEQWKQHGMHAERGEETIETMSAMCAGHDINHIGQIERILRT
jgi:hypothetical protein